MRRSAGWLLAALDAAALTLLGPDVAEVTARAGSLRSWLSHDGMDAVVATVCGAALWLAAAWVAIGLVAALAARLPGTAGLFSARVSAVVLPSVVRRLLAGSAGLGVLLAPVAAGATAPAHAPTRGDTTAQSRSELLDAALVNAAEINAALARAALAAATLPGPAWPSGGPAPSGPAQPGPLPAPVWPRSGSAPGTAGTAGPTDSAPEPAQPQTGAPRRHHGPPHSQPASRAAVRAGDSLWLIAATRLRPDADQAEIAAYWPRIYAANRTVIGDDPALIRPGQVLSLPAVSDGPETNRAAPDGAVTNQEQP